jgi:hypothetical protein
MNNYEDSLKQYKENIQPLSVSDGFENQVFARIKQKKKQRKIAATVGAGVLLFGFLFIGQAILFQKTPGGSMMARPNTIDTDKEEIPVMEDVIFGSSDSTTNYAIQQVSYNEGDGSI